jgi:hypothetical protein
MKHLFLITTILLLGAALVSTRVPMRMLASEGGSPYQVNAGYEIINLLEMSGETGPSSVKYEFEPYRVLKPGQCVILNVPEHLRNQNVNSVILGHRANPEGNRGTSEESTFDNKPALTSVQLGMTGTGGGVSWQYWNGSASGKFGAKFAEPRDDLEIESLYEWYHNGHTDVDTGVRSTEPFSTNVMRICSVGEDPVDLGSLELRTFPGYAQKYIERNFGNGTQMGDSLTAAGRTYGEIAGSITLNGENNGQVPSDWKMTDDSLEIPIESGTIKTFEISVSDTHASTLSQHDDNASSTSGWATLNVFIRKADGTEVPIIEYENVPPRGVIYGVPSSSVKLGKGDRLVINGSDDILHILGLKIGVD